MRYKFFTTSEKAWQGMYEQMISANDSIYLEMYIFSGDVRGYDFVDLLCQKAQKGVAVRVLLDAFGSSDLKKESITKLQKSGAEVLFVSHLLHRIHRKILIIDENVAFLGGANLHESARVWHDLMVQVKGKMTERVVRAFANDYANAGGTDRALLSKSKKIIFHKARRWLVEHSPLRKIFGMKSIYKNRLKEAKSSILIVTPYFAPKRWLLARLHQAILRGVPVTVLVPEKVEIPILTKANYFYMARASKLGIRFELEPYMNHAKIMIIDGREAVVGSQNMDFLSFELNSEIGMFIEDRDAISKIKEIVSKWQADAKPFDPAVHKLSFFDGVLAHVLNLFVRML